MIEQNRTPKEIMIARNILMQGMNNNNLVNLYEYTNFPNN